MRHLVSCKVNLSVSIETSSQGRSGLPTVIGDVKRGGGGGRRGSTFFECTSCPDNLDSCSENTYSSMLEQYRYTYMKVLGLIPDYVITV